MLLVTGGTGLSGQFVTRELVARGHAVRALCRQAPPPGTLPDGVEVVLGDLGDPASLRRATRGATGIVHTACTYTDSAVDVAAMAVLLEGWADGPFVYLSSLDVYGLTDADPVTEDAPLSESMNDYARGKVRCERRLLAMGRSAHVALRAPYIWGPHPIARRRLLPARLLEGRDLILPGRDAAEWSRYRDAWVDVRDLAAIVAACVERPPGVPLNVVTGHFVWHDLYETLLSLTGSASRLVHRPIEEIQDEDLARKELFARTWRFSEARLAATLGGFPRRPFEETVRDTVSVGG